MNIIKQKEKEIKFIKNYITIFTLLITKLIISCV